MGQINYFFIIGPPGLLARRGPSRGVAFAGQFFNFVVGIVVRKKSFFCPPGGMEAFQALNLLITIVHHLQQHHHPIILRSITYTYGRPKLLIDNNTPYSLNGLFKDIQSYLIITQIKRGYQSQRVVII